MRFGVVRGCLGIAVLGLLVSGCARPPQATGSDGSGASIPSVGTESIAPSSGAPSGPASSSVGTPEPTVPPVSSQVSTQGRGPTPQSADARRIRVSGSFEERPDGTVLMCPSLPGTAAAVGSAGGADADTGCVQGVPTVGLHTGGATAGGTGPGQASIEAWWDGRSFVVIAEGPFDTGRSSPGDPPGGDRYPVPCPAPEGGWSSDDPSWHLEEDTLRNAIGPEYAGRRSVYPDGPPVDGIGRKVVLVSTTGDVAAADAAVRSVYPGNICVIAAGWDAATVDRQFEQVRHWMIEGPGARSAAHVFSFGVGADDDGGSRMVIDLLEVTPDVQVLLDELGAPAPEVRAWIEPVG